MKDKMLKFAILVLGLSALPCLALTGFDPDYDAALARAKTSGRQMFVLFTGSDWCGWCIKLEEEVFSKGEFLDFATNNYELVVLDYPMKKKQPEAQKKRNRELSDKFKVRGYPTVLVIDSNEKVVFQTGYEAGGAQKWIESFKIGAGLNPLYTEHLGSFDKRVRDVLDKIRKEFEAADKAVSGDKRKMIETEKAVAAKFLPEVKAVCDDLKAKEVPAELVAKKKDLVTRFERLCLGLEKSANLDVDKALAEIEEIEKAKGDKKKKAKKNSGK